MALAFVYSKSARVLCLAQILCFLLLLPIARIGQASNEIVYVYDELGRLVAVIDTAGEAAVYSYDAVGNLLSISRYNASVVSIIEFTPNSGPVGATVTIWGTGFSTTPSQNTVTFNGVAATVTEATTTKITTTVPVGATTGPIAITTPGGNATSSTSFIVGGTGLPTITDFSPTIGVVGTPVIITGTNFEPTAASNKSKFNVTYSSIILSTSTTIDTNVPAASTSGRITVATPAGSAVSTGDFFVPPSPYQVADVANTGRMAYGETKNVSFPAANKIGLVVFDAVAGQRASIIVSSSTITSTVMTLLSSTGVALGTTTVNTSGGFLEPPILTTTGTYTILIDPNSTYTGNLTFTLHNATDSNGTITIGGPGVNVNITAPGQNAKLTFSGNAGQRVSVGLSNMTLATGYCCDMGSVSILKADGSAILAPYNFNNGGAGTPSSVLPANGTYTILIDPWGSRTGAVTVHLSEDLAPPITINGSAANLNFRPGQNAALPFEGTAGQRVSIGASDMNIATGYCCDIGNVSILKPDGTVLMAPVNFTNGGQGTPSPELPVSGTYLIMIDVWYARSGVMTVTLSSDIAQQITINGAAASLTFRPGQNARLTFDGTAGQRVSVGVSDMTIATGYCCDIGSVSIQKPDGTTLLAPYNFTNGGQGTLSSVLPVTGTYAIVIDPWYARSGNMTVTLSEDLAPPISINGTPANLTFRPGQNARLTFEGTAGQRVSIGLSNMTLATGYCCDIGNVSIQKPDGTTLLAPYNFTNGGQGTPSSDLPVTGTYAILIDPWYARSGNMTVTLSADLAEPITINGPAVSLNFNPGQNARLTFEGTAGQRVSVGVSDMTLAVGYCCDIGSISIQKPDGTTLMAPYNFTNGGQGTPSVLLPVSGTYAILIDPWYQRSGAMTVHLSEDLAPAIAINGAAVNLTYRPGQNARLTFSGTAGQRVSVGVSDMTLAVGYCCDIGSISIVKPDGTTLLSPYNFTNGGQGTPSVLLPVSGTYAIAIDPWYQRSGNMTVTLSEDLAPSITINGAAVNLTYRTGQNARLPFEGTAGQRVSVGVSDMTLATGYCCDIGSISIVKPDGTVLQSPFNFTNGGQGTPTATLTVSGTYAIVIDPWYQRSGNMTVTLSEDLSPSITINGDAVNLTFRPGQNGKLTFTGTAGQRVSVGLSDMTLAVGYCCDIGNMWVNKPDGTALIGSMNFTNGGAGTASAVLPTTGTYSIFIDPWYQRSGNMTVTLSEDLAPAITINGAAADLNFRAGQNARLTFSGTAGQRVSVGLSAMTFAVGYCCDTGTFSMLKPDGTALVANVNFVNGGFTTASQVLPVTGTYAIVIDPWYARYGLATVTLSEDLSPPISAGGPSVTLSNRIGQNGRLTFSGTSGQVITVVVSNNTIGTTAVALLKPDGTTLTSTNSAATNFNLATSTLPTTGTYSVNVDPSGIATGSITLLLYDPATSAATLKADYRFENNRDSSVSGAPTLTDLGTNSFTTATVDGVSKNVLSFVQNDGLSLSPTTGLVASTSYSVVMLFSFEQISSWRRVFDVKNGTADAGLYLESGKLNFYPSGVGSTTIAANTYVQVVLTRNPLGTVTGYINGTQQFQFNDSSSNGVISTANTLRFFRDDNSASQASPGSVARIRVYDGVLTASQVSALDRLP